MLRLRSLQRLRSPKLASPLGVPLKNIGLRVRCPERRAAKTRLARHCRTVVAQWHMWHGQVPSYSKLVRRAASAAVDSSYNVAWHFVRHDCTCAIHGRGQTGSPGSPGSPGSRVKVTRDRIQMSLALSSSGTDGALAMETTQQKAQQEVLRFSESPEAKSGRLRLIGTSRLETRLRLKDTSRLKGPKQNFASAKAREVLRRLCSTSLV